MQDREKVSVSMEYEVFKKTHKKYISDGKTPTAKIKMYHILIHTVIEMFIFSLETKTENTIQKHDAR